MFGSDAMPKSAASDVRNFAVSLVEPEFLTCQWCGIFTHRQANQRVMPQMNVNPSAMDQPHPSKPASRTVSKHVNI